MFTRIRPIESAFKAYKGLLNLIFCYANEYGIISVNPVLFIKNAIYLKGCDRTKAKPEDKILSPEEIERVIQTVRERMPHKRYHGYFINGYAILLSIETGMRVGELCALKWSDIKDDVIHIHAFRMLINSNVFITLGIPVTERARLLGHSVDTNQKYYSYA